MKKLSWIGTITSVIGSFIVAMGLGIFGYCLFLVGSISWLTVGVTRRDTSLVTLNGFFLAANMIGLYNAVF